MKKAISLLVLGVLLLVISGCGTDEFSSALKNTNEATSYQMELEMQVPIVGTINATIMMEENKSYIRTTGSTSIFGDSVTTEETYAEVVGDVTFEYYQDVNGKWVKRNEADSIFSNGVVDSEVDSEIAGLEDEIFEEIDPNEFTKDDDGYYVGSIELALSLSLPPLNSFSFAPPPFSLTCRSISSYRTFSDSQLLIYVLWFSAPLIGLSGFL